MSSRRPTGDQMQETLENTAGKKGKLIEHEPEKNPKTQITPDMSSVHTGLTGLVWYGRDSTKSLWEKK